MQLLINAKQQEEIIFVKGATEAINLVAHSYGMMNLGNDDEILITQMEHHANIVPWQQVVSSDRIKVCRIDASGQLDLDDLRKNVLKTKIVAFTCF